MTEVQEKILHQDAHANNRQAAEMSRSKLDSAVRKGIGEGRVRARRRNVFYASGGVLVVAAMLLMTFSLLQPAGEFATDSNISAHHDWGEFEVFREAAEGDPRLIHALNQGEVRPFNVSEQQKEYTATLNGVAADSRSMFLLYSVQNDSDQPIVIGSDKFESDSKGRGTTSSSSGSYEVEPGQIVYRVLSVMIDPDTDSWQNASLDLLLTTNTAEAKLSSSMKYRTELRLPFELDRSLLVAKERVWKEEPAASMTVDGQNVHIVRTVATPIGTYVDIAYDEANTKKVFGLIRPRLTVERSGKSEELMMSAAYLTDTSGSRESLQFAGIIPEDTDSVTLDIDGISAFNKDELELTIDTEAMQILKAPDSKISVEAAGDDYAEGYIALKRSGKYQEGMANNIVLGSLFTDGNGAKHTVEYGDTQGQVTYSSTEANGEESNTWDYFYIGTKQWPQPLTFSIESYPHPILEATKIRLY